MERWTGRIALVTGAGAGIGAGIAQRLVKEGMKVVGLARRPERIQALADGLKDAPGKLYAVKADVGKEEDILAAFKWTKDNLGGVDVVVNNASASNFCFLTDGKTAHWKEHIDVDVLGVSICTREAIQSMRERGVDDGHIININGSGSGFPGIFMAMATKHALTALTEGLRKELVQLKSNIRVTSLAPGAVDTEMTRKANIPEEVLNTIPMLKPDDVAEAAVYALSRPARVQVHEIVVYPTGGEF